MTVGEDYLRAGRAVLRRLEVLEPGPLDEDLQAAILAFAADAPTPAHERLSRVLAQAVHEWEPEAGGAGIRPLVRQLLKCPDRRAEKIISHRFGFLWICIPKVASRSIIAALTSEAVGGELIKGRTTEEVLAEHPQAAGYFKFAFVRHP